MLLARAPHCPLPLRIRFRALTLTQVPVHSLRLALQRITHARPAPQPRLMIPVRDPRIRDPHVRRMPDTLSVRTSALRPWPSSPPPRPRGNCTPTTCARAAPVHCACALRLCAAHRTRSAPRGRRAAPPQLWGHRTPLSALQPTRTRPPLSSLCPPPCPPCPPQVLSRLADLCLRSRAPAPVAPWLVASIAHSTCAPALPRALFLHRIPPLKPPSPSLPFPSLPLSPSVSCLAQLLTIAPNQSQS